MFLIRDMVSVNSKTNLNVKFLNKLPHFKTLIWSINSIAQLIILSHKKINSDFHFLSWKVATFLNQQIHLQYIQGFHKITQSIFSYRLQGKGNNRRATLPLALKRIVHNITREIGEHYSREQLLQKAKMMKYMVLWNNSANWGVVEQHRHGIIMPNWVALLHMCLLVWRGSSSCVTLPFPVATSGEHLHCTVPVAALPVLLHWAGRVQRWQSVCQEPFH